MLNLVIIPSDLGQSVVLEKYFLCFLKNDQLRDMVFSAKDGQNKKPVAAVLYYPVLYLSTKTLSNDQDL